MASVPAPIPLFKVFVPEGAHAALKPVLESGRLAAGPRVADFESRLATWLGAPSCTALADASGALMLALYMAGVRPGDEVIASPLACAASLMPIANLFAQPVWCDVDPLTGMINAERLEGLTTERTRAILLCHWSGDVGDVEGVASFARRRGLALVEDATEALGAERAGHRLGAAPGGADFTVYSFYATKHINGGGEGAALLAADPAHIGEASRMRRFGIDYGRFRLSNGDLNPSFDIPVAGYNLAMNEIAATLAAAGLDHADALLARHRENGRFYESALAGVPGVCLLARRPDAVSAYWTFSLLSERRDDLIRKLAAVGIGAQRLHVRNDTYACFSGHRREMPGVAAFDAGNLSIPCGWWVGEAERTRVVECIRTGW